MYYNATDKSTTHTENLPFKTTIKIPHLPLSRGNMKEIEINSDDPQTTLSFTVGTIRGFLLSRANQMETGPQGFFLPGAGSIKWKQLVLPNDSPINNAHDTDEIINDIRTILLSPITNHSTL